MPRHDRPMTDQELAKLIAALPPPPDLDLQDLSHRVGRLEQLVIGQAVALSRVAEWMVEQPGAHRETLHGMTSALGAAPVLLRYLGVVELADELERGAERSFERARGLPEP